MSNSRCIIEGCNKFEKAKRYCSIHLKEFLPEEHRKFYDKENKRRNEKYNNDSVFREKVKRLQKVRQKRHFTKNYRKNPEWTKKYLAGLKKNHKKHREKYKLNVMNHYSNNDIRCMCEGCSERNIEFMSIDHINGGGSKHRKEVIGGAGMTTYSWLIKNNYPEGFRVLCHNCNNSRGYYGYCPHSGSTVMG